MSGGLRVHRFGVLLPLRKSHVSRDLTLQRITHSSRPSYPLRPFCSGGESDVTAMFTRIVAAVAPGDLVRLYEMLSCFLASMGYLTGHDGEDGGGLGLGDTARGADAGNAQAMRALAQSAARACISGLRARAAHAADPIAAAVATAGTIEQVAQAVGLQAGAPG